MIKRVAILVTLIMLVGFSAGAMGRAGFLKEWLLQSPGYVLPILKRDSLLNGLHLIVLEQKGTGSVSARLRINSGGLFDLAGKGGLADLTAGMLLKGGGALTEKSLQEIVEQNGLKLSIAAGWDSTDLIMSGPADSLDTMFELMGRLIINPTFDQKELESLKAARIASIKDEAGEEVRAVRKKALEAVFGSHPYGRPLRGTPESVAKITRQDLVYYHGRFYIANNSELMITGDATQEAVTRLARARLGAWKKGDKVPATFRPPEAASSRRLMMNDRPGLSSAFAVIAQPGLSRRATDYYAAMIMTELLFDECSKLASPGSVLETTVETRYLPGPLIIGVRAAPADIVGRVEGVISAMISLQTRTAPLDQFEAAKARLINRFAEQMRSTDTAAQIILDVELYGLGRDYLVNFADRVSAVAQADVMRAAQAYLKPQSVVVVVAGPATQIESSLKRLGAVTALP